MTVKVMFWSYFRDRTGTGSEDIDVPSGATLGDALGVIYSRWPALESLKGCTLMAVGVDYARPDHLLKEGDEISLFPPVQGG